MVLAIYICLTKYEPHSGFCATGNWPHIQYCKMIDDGYDRKWLSALTIFFWDGFANCNIRIPCTLRWWPCSPQSKLIWLKQRLGFCGTLGLQWETIGKRCAYSSRILWKILLLKSHDNEPLLITISHQKLYYIMPYTPKKHNSSIRRAFVFIKVWQYPGHGIICMINDHIAIYLCVFGLSKCLCVSVCNALN